MNPMKPLTVIRSWVRAPGFAEYFGVMVLFCLGWFGLLVALHAMSR